MTKINVINNKSYSLTTDTFITAMLGDITATNGDLYLNDLTATIDGPYAIFNKEHGAGVPVTTADQLGVLAFSGTDSAGHNSMGSAIISTVTAGTIGANQIPTSLSFLTHGTAVAAAPTLRMTIAATGEVTIAAPDSGVGLTITAGGETITAGNLEATAGQIYTVNNYITAGSTSTTVGSRFNMTRYHGVGGTVVSGDGLGRIYFRGFDGTSLSEGAIIWSETTGTIAAGRMPTNLSIWTAPDSISGAQQNLTINADRTVQINALSWGAIVSNATGILSSQTPGVIGSIFMSNGPTALPTWQAAPGVANTVLTSNGVGFAPTYQAITMPTSFNWTPVAVNKVFADHETGKFLALKAGADITFLLPVHANVGEEIRIAGSYDLAADQYYVIRVNQNATQYMLTPSRGGNITASSTTPGIGGYITTSYIVGFPTLSAFTLVCIEADKGWFVIDIAGGMNVY